VETLVDFHQIWDGADLASLNAYVSQQVQGDGEAKIVTPTLPKDLPAERLHKEDVSYNRRPWIPS